MTREEYSKLIKSLHQKTLSTLCGVQRLQADLKELNHTGQVEKMNWLIPWRRNLLSE